MPAAPPSAPFPDGPRFVPANPPVSASPGPAVLTAVLATTAGYGFGRGRGIIFAVTLLALMVPYQAILTP